MAIMLAVLKAAGAPETKIRLARIETKLDVALWLLGGLFVTLASSQFALWLKFGEVTGQLAQIGAQLAHAAGHG